MSKPSKKQKTTRAIEHKVADYENVLSSVVELLDAARRASARAVNSLMTATYWEMGRRIVESEQRGAKRADYGKELIVRLSADLTRRFGRGFSERNLEQMRLMYLTWRIPQTASAKSGNSGPAQIPQTVSAGIRLRDGGARENDCNHGVAIERPFLVRECRTSPEGIRVGDRNCSDAQTPRTPDGTTPTGAAEISLKLRSAVGERGKWSGGRNAADSGMKPERNAPPPNSRRKPRRACGRSRMPARDERAVCGAERVRSSGRQGRPAARGAKHNRALVTADKTIVTLRFFNFTVASNAAIHAAGSER